MIFVTVGTHEQPFNRLIQKIDELKRDGTIQDEVIIQTGFSTYEPKYCQWSKLIPYQQMVKNVADALELSEDQVNIKATTEEGLGFTGSGEGISSQAVCMLSSIREWSVMAASSEEGCKSCGGCRG